MNILIIGEHFERGMEPVDIDEISKISAIIILKIKESDPDQYAALVDSIDEEPLYQLIKEDLWIETRKQCLEGYIIV